MLLGKRPIKRTSSMKEMTLEAPEPSDPQNPMRNESWVPGHDMMAVGTSVYVMATVSPRHHSKKICSSGDDDDTTAETAHFLRMCGLCRRRLSPGRDIYMYRGDTAFCSVECREHQMKHDEREEATSEGSSTVAAP